MSQRLTLSVGTQLHMSLLAFFRFFVAETYRIWGEKREEWSKKVSAAGDKIVKLFPLVVREKRV